MKIFYAKIEKLLSAVGIDKLKEYAQNIQYKSKNRFIEHCAGRFLVINVCKNFYNIENPKIITINKKPKLENNEICLSITHSNGYVMAVFDDDYCAIDLEKIRPVNLEKMSLRYNKNFKTLDEFFIYWTQYECSIKQSGKINFLQSGKLENDYIYTVSSSKNDIKNIKAEMFSI
jgi:phosphopantetheinyl transferase